MNARTDPVYPRSPTSHRRLETALRKVEAKGRIVREPDGQWDVEKTRAAWSRPPIPSDRRSLADAAFGNDLSSDTTPFARLKLAEFAVMIEARRLALDEETSRLLDAAVATAAIDDRSGAMRDALLNWPCPHVRADRH